MRSKRRSSLLSRAVVALAVLALVAAVCTPFVTVRAQGVDPVSGGSPASQLDPTIEPPPVEEEPVETDSEIAEAPVVSLVTPTAIIVDTLGTGAPIDPCASIDAGWVSVMLVPVVDAYWTSVDGTAGGNIFVDYSTAPVSFSWDTLGGGVVWAAIVPDRQGESAVEANFYDYRPFGGSVGGDGGLVAPGGELTGAYLCLEAPPAPATETPAPSATSETGQPEASATQTVEQGSATSDDAVEPAAIGIGSTVRASEALNLRSSPVIGNNVIAVLSAGTLATVVGGPQTASGYTWWQLSTPSGTGWAVSQYLIEQPSGTATSTPTRTPTRTATSTIGGIGIGSSVRVTQLLNLRTGPGTSASVIGTMPTGTIGTVLGGPQTANGMTWWQLSTPIGTGWAAAPYLAATGTTSSPTATRTATRTPTATQSVVVNTQTATRTLTPSRTATTSPSAIAIGDLVRTTTSINFRTAPGTQAGVVTVLPTGAQGTVVGGPASATGFVWWQLQTASGIGWAAAPYLTKIGVAPTATSTRTATVSPTPSITLTPSLTLTPSITPTPSLTSVPSATNTPTTTRTPSLTPTRTLTPTTTSTPSITPTVGQCGSFGYGDIVRTNSSVNFRSTPTTSGSIIRTLQLGERGTVRGGPVSANGYTWCQIQVGSVTGWVANQYLTRVSGPIPTPNGTVTPRPDPPNDPGGGSALVIYGGSASSSMIALTYDAGADRGQAAYILDTLAEYGVKATFGMTGTWARDNPDLVARMVAEGHQLINHTWSHPSFTGGSSSTTVLTRTGRLDQLDRTEAIVEQQTGYQMAPYWRPPYGDINASVLSDVYAGGYYLTIMWTCDSLGWNGASEQQILNRCMYPMGAGDIILMHVGADGLDWAATDNMIEYFLAQGLQIVTVEEMLGS